MSKKGAREVTSFCRVCSAGCGTRLKIDHNDRIVDIRGDNDQPMTRGYVCFKGLQAEEAHHGPARLLHPLKRQPDGSFKEIPLEQALDEIAEKMRPYYERGDKDALALFTGNGVGPCPSAHGMHFSFMASLGSSAHYTTITIDQSAKIVSFERLGGWMAGVPSIEQSDVALLFGANPKVSHICVGLVTAEPTPRIKAATQRGLNMIVVDPRRNETARFASLVLQPLPGQDPAIVGAIIRIILDEGWYDREFTDRFAAADGLAALRTTVEPLTEEYVEKRAGLEPGQLRKAAEMFARDNKRGAAFTATGPSMSPHSNLSQHLVDCLNVICGRFRRAGDQVAVDMYNPEQPIYAEAISPPRSWQSIAPGRIRGVGLLGGERLTATLPEEILTPGKGQIRCLISGGANPVNSVPDTRRMIEALKDLDLYVAIDPYMTPSAKYAHYILPPKMQYERPDLPLTLPGFSLFSDNWMQYTPALVAPPADSEVCDDWYPFWAIAKRLGFPINYVNKAELPTDAAPTTDELLEIRMRGAPVSLEEIKRYASGHIWELESALVQPARAEAEGRFDLMPDDVVLEMQQFLELPVRAGEIISRGKPFTHLMSSRRMPDVFCSNGNQLDSTLKRTPFNPAYMHPDELKAIGISDGATIRVTSDHGSIYAIAREDGDVRPGVVSMAWGGDSAEPDADWDGAANVNFLIACDRDVEEINAMPRMSAIPVNLEIVADG